MAVRLRFHFGSGRWVMLAAMLALLAGCGGARAPLRHAAHVQPDDTCAVCGMELSSSPGPRGQAWVAGHPRPLMFDSIRDFFAYVLQPENQADLQDLFVQDTTRIDWQHPGRDAASFIDARSALYVAWQPLPGSMGPTLAPFASRTAAETFVREHGGAVLAFNGITPAMVATLGYRCPDRASAGHAAHTPQCAIPRPAAGSAVRAAPGPPTATARLQSRAH